MKKDNAERDAREAKLKAEFEAKLKLSGSPKAKEGDSTKEETAKKGDREEGASTGSTDKTKEAEHKAIDEDAESPASKVPSKDNAKNQISKTSTEDMSNANNNAENKDDSKDDSAETSNSETFSKTNSKESNTSSATKPKKESKLQEMRRKKREAKEAKEKETKNKLTKMGLLGSGSPSRSGSTSGSPSRSGTPSSGSGSTTGADTSSATGADTTSGTDNGDNAGDLNDNGDNAGDLNTGDLDNVTVPVPGNADGSGSTSPVTDRKRDMQQLLTQESEEAKEREDLNKSKNTIAHRMNVIPNSGYESESESESGETIQIKIKSKGNAGKVKESDNDNKVGSDNNNKAGSKENSKSSGSKAKTRSFPEDSGPDTEESEDDDDDQDDQDDSADVNDGDGNESTNPTTGKTSAIPPDDNLTPLEQWSKKMNTHVKTRANKAKKTTAQKGESQKGESQKGESESQKTTEELEAAAFEKEMLEMKFHAEKSEEALRYRWSIFNAVHTNDLPELKQLLRFLPADELASFRKPDDQTGSSENGQTILEFANHMEELQRLKGEEVEKQKEGHKEEQKGADCDLFMNMRLAQREEMRGFLERTLEERKGKGNSDGETPFWQQREIREEEYLKQMNAGSPGVESKAGSPGMSGSPGSSGSSPGSNKSWVSAPWSVPSVPGDSFENFAEENLNPKDLGEKSLQSFLDSLPKRVTLDLLKTIPEKPENMREVILEQLEDVESSIDAKIDDIHHRRYCGLGLEKVAGSENDVYPALGLRGYHDVVQPAGGNNNKDSEDCGNDTGEQRNNSGEGGITEQRTNNKTGEHTTNKTENLTEAALEKLNKDAAATRCAEEAKADARKASGESLYSHPNLGFSDLWRGERYDDTKSEFTTTYWNTGDKVLARKCLIPDLWEFEWGHCGVMRGYSRGEDGKADDKSLHGIPDPETISKFNDNDGKNSTDSTARPFTFHSENTGIRIGAGDDQIIHKASPYCQVIKSNADYKAWLKREQAQPSWSTILTKLGVKEAAVTRHKAVGNKGNNSGNNEIANNNNGNANANNNNNVNHANPTTRRMALSSLEENLNLFPFETGKRLTRTQVSADKTALGELFRNEFILSAEDLLKADYDGDAFPMGYE
jgi:hypothetical protein